VEREIPPRAGESARVRDDAISVTAPAIKRKRAKRAFVASQTTRRIARLA
jgi:hypothetical protein